MIKGVNPQQNEKVQSAIFYTNSTLILISAVVFTLLYTTGD